MFWFSGAKKEVKKLKQEVGESFDHVKRDFNKVGDWIKHIDGIQGEQKEDILELKNDLYEMRKDLEDIKNFISFFGEKVSNQSQTSVGKQTTRETVQTPVQTAVQTSFLDGLTVMERAVIWALLNADMKLSYEDLAALLGKGKSTVRGQINSIKQKSDIIEEITEKSGKKRLYIPENVRQILIKQVKVRVKDEKKAKNAKSES